MKKSFLAFLLFGLILFSCSKDSPDVIAPAAKAFLNEVLNIMEANFIRKNQIDWNDIRAKVFEKVGNAKTIDETYSGINEALILLDERHCFFIKPNGEYILGLYKNCSAEKTTTPIVPSNIGYVKITSITDVSSSIPAYNYANEIQTQIKNADNSSIKGWILDLRGNNGGNMYPMLAGIGPLLGDGTAGSFVSADNRISIWGYNSGSAFINSTSQIQITNPYNLLKPDPKIAILIDKAVASSGEIIAIAFIGKEKIKLFGSPSCGLSTANSTYSLSNQSKLILTTSNVADRTGKTYGSPLIPDENIDNGSIITKAIEWISN